MAGHVRKFEISEAGLNRIASLEIAELIRRLACNLNPGVEEDRRAMIVVIAQALISDESWHCEASPAETMVFIEQHMSVIDSLVIRALKGGPEAFPDDIDRWKTEDTTAGSGPAHERAANILVRFLSSKS